MKLSVVGLGKLGSCYTAFYASKGHTLVGTDIDAKKVKALAVGRPPVEETRLAEYIAEHKERILATTNITEAVSLTDATFIIVPTPSKKDGSFSVDYVVEACKKIGKALQKKDTYHLVCVVSTVLPGDSREYIIPALESASGKICGVDFGYCYNPSLIAIGDVIENLEKPDFIFLGEFDKKSGDTLATIYTSVYPTIIPERMSVESVELAKIALNSYVTMKITFANTLSMLAEQIPHANVDSITGALGKDKRIGSAYLKAGLGYGGPCFPRDNFAFANMARKRGVNTPVALATHSTNETIPERMSEVITEHAKKIQTKKIGMLGISYKPKTTLTEDSQARTIAELLVKKGYALSIFEPLGTEEARRVFNNKATYHDSLSELVTSADILFISNKDTLFSELVLILNKTEAPKTVIDPWGMFKKEDFAEHITYRAIGRK